MSRAREALLDRRSDWQDLFRRGFGSPNNLTIWREHDRVVKWAHDSPVTALAGLNAIWIPTPTSPTERVSGFLARLPLSVLRGAGVRLAVASYLMMAIDTTQFPIYRSVPMKRGFELLR